MREHAAGTLVAEKPTVAKPAAPTHSPERARVARSAPGRQIARETSPRGLGNRATMAALANAGVRVTSPTDQVEREASAVATLATSGGRTSADAAASPAAALAQLTAGSRSPSLPPMLAAALADGGSAIDAGVRSQLEGVVGADLGQVRVHSGGAAAEAAASVSARAFTIGSDVVLGAGESPTDVELLAHEATHVVQQTAGTSLLALMREGDGQPAAAADSSWIPDSVLNEIRDLVRAIPGYALACAAIGQDLLTGRPAQQGLGETVETLLVAGPFGAGVGAVLRAMDILDSAASTISQTLAQHNLTISRVTADLAAAWDRFEVSKMVDGNVAIADEYVDRFVADIRAAIADLVDQLLTAVRHAVVSLVEPLLQDPAVAPVWNLATKVMGYNPLLGEQVRAPTVEILGDFLTLIGKGEVVAQMAERGTLQQTADWLDTQLATFSGLISQAEALFQDAWDAISPANLPNLLHTLPALAGRAVRLFDGVVAFATTVIGKVRELVKDSLLGMLSEQAHKLRGFRLLTVILGRNPFTGATVDRSPENLIGGFIDLVAGPDTYRQLAESGVIAEAAGRIETEMTRLNISWELITGTFTAIWDSMSLTDLLDPIGAIERVIHQFEDPLSRIISFAATVIQVVLELVLRLMNFPSDLLSGIIAGVEQALTDIQRDPVAFLENMLAALKQGFQQFFDNILMHLLQGLADWLFHGLRGLGITIPTELSGQAILKLVLDVLGLSVDFLWDCLGEVIGADRVTQIRGALGQLGEAWAFISDVQERGVSALWDHISGQLGNLWDTILTMAKDWLQQNLIEAAIEKVLSMLDPTGVMAVINSFIAFYRGVQSVIEYIREILQIVKTYVDTLAAIAAGNVAPGANMLETALGNAIPVAIGFLASQVGLGNVPEKIVEIINGLRQTIRDALIWLIRRALELGRAALDALTGGAPATGPGTPSATDPAAPTAGDLIPEGLPPDGIKAAVLEKVQQNASGGLGNVTAFLAMVHRIEQANLPRGLRSLTVTVPDPTSLDLHVVAAASPASEHVVRWADVVTSAPAGLEAEMGRQGQGTVASVVWEGHTRGVGRSSGLHAEMSVVSGPAWPSVLSDVKARPPGEATTITLMINRTPCQACAQGLVGAIQSARTTLGAAAMGSRSGLCARVSMSPAYPRATKVRPKSMNTSCNGVNEWDFRHQRWKTPCLPSTDSGSGTTSQR